MCNMFCGKLMFLYMLIAVIKDNLKLFNNTHIFDHNILEKPFVVVNITKKQVMSWIWTTSKFYVERINWKFLKYKRLYFHKERDQPHPQ